jgi:hypothetical protein
MFPSPVTDLKTFVPAKDEPHAALLRSAQRSRVRAPALSVGRECKWACRMLRTARNARPRYKEVEDDVQENQDV